MDRVGMLVIVMVWGRDWKAGGIRATPTRLRMAESALMLTRLTYAIGVLAHFPDAPNWGGLKKEVTGLWNLY